MTDIAVGAEWARKMSRIVGRRLSRWRKFRDLTTQEVAELTRKAGFPISTAAVNRMELGKPVDLSIQKVLVICMILKVDPQYIIFGSPDDPTLSETIPNPSLADAVSAAQYAESIKEGE